ncbi:MAG: hypothetical protein V4525_16490 [Pseudomonadota bacterium]
MKKNILAVLIVGSIIPISFAQSTWNNASKINYYTGGDNLVNNYKEEDDHSQQKDLVKNHFKPTKYIYTGGDHEIVLDDFFTDKNNDTNYSSQQEQNESVDNNSYANKVFYTGGDH